MRKRTISRVADTIFWYVLYFLPIVAFLLLCLAEPSNGAVAVNFNEFMSTWGISLANPVYSVLVDIFGSSDIMMFFEQNGIFLYFCWFVGVYLIHLCIDFLMFIPRLAHKWLNSFLRGDEY